MGFALWLEEELAWAAGTHEYRPMGTAVIAATDLFSPRDFSPLRRAPRDNAPSYVGLFASLGEVNAWLCERRRGAVSPRPPGSDPRRPNE